MVLENLFNKLITYILDLDLVWQKQLLFFKILKVSEATVENRSFDNKKNF